MHADLLDRILRAAPCHVAAAQNYRLSRCEVAPGVLRLLQPELLRSGLHPRSRKEDEFPSCWFRLPIWINSLNLRQHVPSSANDQLQIQLLAWRRSREADSEACWASSRQPPSKAYALSCRSVGELPTIRIPLRHARLKIRVMQRLVPARRKPQHRQLPAQRRDFATNLEFIRFGPPFATSIARRLWWRRWSAVSLPEFRPQEALAVGPQIAQRVRPDATFEVRPQEALVQSVQTQILDEFISIVVHKHFRRNRSGPRPAHRPLTKIRQQG